MVGCCFRCLGGKQPDHALFKQTQQTIRQKRTHCRRTSDGYGSGGNFRADADGWDINLLECIDNPLIHPVQVFFKCKKLLSFPL